MTALQLIETKISELNRDELFILLEKVTHSLKTHTIGKKSNRDAVLNYVSKFEGRNYFPEIKNPVQWQKELRDEWER